MKKILLCMVLLLFYTTANAGQKQLNFAWDEQIEPDLAGFTLYEYDSAGVPTGTVVDIPYIEPFSWTYGDVFTVPDDVVTTRCYDLDAYDTSGEHSELSNRVCVDIDFLPPGAPTNFTVTIQVVSE